MADLLFFRTLRAHLPQYRQCILPRGVCHRGSFATIAHLRLRECFHASLDTDFISDTEAPGFSFASSATRKWRVNMLPAPSLLTTETLPPKVSAISFVNASPNPVPCIWAFSTAGLR